MSTLSSQASTLDQLRSRTANRRSRRASRQQSQGSLAPNELEGVEGNKYASPPASSRRNHSRDSTGTPKTPLESSRPSTSLSIPSNQGADEGSFVSVKLAAPLAETKLVEEKSDDLVGAVTSKLPPGPPPGKLRRANKKSSTSASTAALTTTSASSASAPPSSVSIPISTSIPNSSAPSIKRVSIADSFDPISVDNKNEDTSDFHVQEIDSSTMDNVGQVQISIVSPYVTPKSNTTTPEKLKSFASPESQKSIGRSANRKLLVCGKAENGRLGLHSSASSHILKPQRIRHFASRVQEIAAGRDHTLALSSDGSIYAWGLGHDGRLGLGNEDTAHYPTKISFGPIADQIVTAIACGEMHCLAVTDSRKVFSWGRNYYGRLGHGDSNNRSVPEMIRSLSHLSINNVSAGVAYSAAVSVEGNLYTWGYGGHGQLGHNDKKNYSQPLMVKSMSDEIVTKVEAAYGHTLCLTATGELFSWGSGNGLLGLSDTNARLTPTQVTLLSGVEIIDICSGYDHSLALNSVGEVYSWGNGGYGQLGQSEGNLCISTPEVVSGLSGQQCVSIAAGEYSSVAITAVGSIFSWGGGFGALGHEDVKNVYEPKLVEALKDCNVVSCAVGSVHALVLVEMDSTFESEAENSYMEDSEILQDFDEESSVEDAGADAGADADAKGTKKRNGGDVSLESSVSSVDFDAPILLGERSEPLEDLDRMLKDAEQGPNSASKNKLSASPQMYRNADGTSSLGQVDEDEWLDEGEGAISLRVNDAPKYAAQSPELYSRETLFKYGDTLARFGYQGFSGEENYRKKYALRNHQEGQGGGGEEEESPPTHKYPTKDDVDGIGVRTPTTYMRSTPSTGRTIGTTTFYNNVGSSASRGPRVPAVGKGGGELSRWLDKHDLGELYESLSGSGFGSLESLSKNVEFTDGALEEMGVFKKGLRMQFLAALKKLRSFKLVANVVRGEGMKSGRWCGPTRRRVSVRWLGNQKMTRVATGNKPMWSETLIFQSADQNEAERGEVIMEVIQNGVAKSSCSVSFEEIDRVPSEVELGDGKPYPLVS
eukprot:CAMPEP_0118642234 /NCGR_PEP_ID=MMETSP0785-20121206/5730_1 /TAXON_ID=91992 /ORGANISM="Bolidomonas pacifica, Strain CCMP 1866" /LENGTH=1049 /DNA_ID=CAMNT_0006533779 /DNA_START=23 /DNA_END=3169 /DNA_ORIENTATION=+